MIYFIVPSKYRGYLIARGVISSQGGSVLYVGIIFIIIISISMEQWLVYNRFYYFIVELIFFITSIICIITGISLLIIGLILRKQYLYG